MTRPVGIWYQGSGLDSYAVSWALYYWIIQHYEDYSAVNSHELLPLNWQVM